MFRTVQWLTEGDSHSLMSTGKTGYPLVSQERHNSREKTQTHTHTQLLTGARSDDGTYAFTLPRVPAGKRDQNRAKISPRASPDWASWPERGVCKRSCLQAPRRARRRLGVFFFVCLFSAQLHRNCTTRRRKFCVIQDRLSFEFYSGAAAAAPHHVVPHGEERGEKRAEVSAALFCHCAAGKSAAMSQKERPTFYRQELNKTVWEVPERYQNLSPVGSGAYGSVW